MDERAIDDGPGGETREGEAGRSATAPAKRKTWGAKA